MSQLVVNQSIHSDSGLPTGNRCGRCGYPAGVRSCAFSRNAAKDQSGQPPTGDAAALGLSRQALTKTKNAIPPEDHPDRDPSHAMLFRAAANATGLAKKGNFAAAAEFHKRAAAAHDAAAEGYSEVGNDGAASDHHEAAAFHGMAATTCRGFAGMTGNAYSAPVEPLPLIPSIVHDLQTNSGRFAADPQSGKDFEASRGQKSGKQKFPADKHSFDDTLGDTGDVSDPTIDDRYDVYWDPNKRKWMSGNDIIEMALRGSGVRPDRFDGLDGDDDGTNNAYSDLDAPYMPNTMNAIIALNRREGLLPNHTTNTMGQRVDLTGYDLNPGLAAAHAVMLASDVSEPMAAINAMTANCQQQVDADGVLPICPVIPWAEDSPVIAEQLRRGLI